MAKRRKKVTANGFFKPYKSYRFMDKDPVIDQMRTIVQDSGLSYKKIQDRSGVSSTTLRAWFYGGTRRPQYCTVQAAGRACGKTLVWADR